MRAPTAKELGIAFFVAAFLTAWAGIWWVNSEQDFARYFSQAFLFVLAGLFLLAASDTRML